MRDFVGYGPDVPLVSWPGKARIAVQFALNYEEGAERSVLDGDPSNEDTEGDPTKASSSIKNWRDSRIGYAT